MLFLLQTYLGSASSPYLADIEVSEDPRRIIGSRFLIQGANIRDANDEKIFVEELRNICHASKYNVTVFHPYFIYFDQVSTSCEGKAKATQLSIAHYSWCT